MTDPVRLLVALDAAAHDPAAIAILAEVAQELDAELAALIVQDPDLLRLARLPFALEFGAVTASERPLDAEQLGAALRARSLRAEQALSALPRAHATRFSLRFAKGKIVPEALAAAAGSDFVLFGAARPRLRPRTPQRAPTRRQIVLLLEDAPLPVRPLQVAMQLQRGLTASLSILVVGPEEAFARLRDEASARLAAGSTTARFRRVAAREGSAVAQTAASEGAELIVLPRESRWAGTEHLPTVLAETCCSLLWVR
jgi:hypothetical protein